MPPIRVLVVDDHPLFRRGLVAGLAGEKDIRVVGEAADGLEAAQKAESLLPDVVVMDLEMPRCGGIEATALIREKAPNAHVVILTVSEQNADLMAAVKAGAKGYILKRSDPQEVVQAIVHVAEGDAIITPSMAAKLLREFAPDRTARPSSGEDTLTDREREVLEHLVKGSSNKEIAESLMIAENTVKSHLRSILEKLQVRSRGEAAVYALRKGLVKP